MLKYSYKKVDEEIARWTAEVFVKSNPKLGWWIAFTNPTAGPWKKLESKKAEGCFEEAYRFGREEKRPDLVLVNDILKKVIIIEAKDLLKKIISDNQMPKSLEVVKDMTDILSVGQKSSWNSRISYDFISSFLWYSEKNDQISEEDKEVKDAFENHYIEGVPRDIMNIIIIEENKRLVPKFIYNSVVSDIPTF